MFLIYLISLLSLTRRGVLTLLSPPVNVTIESVNLQSELSWNALANDDNVQYTVQYRVNRDLLHGSSEVWLVLPNCASIGARRCNLTSAIPVVINATLRVQAQDRKQTSRWSLSRPFKAIDQTLLGPPNVTLWPRPETGLLDVRLRDPFSRKDFSHELKYRLYYKKEGGDWMIYDDILSSASIDKLDVGFNYCVKAEYVWRRKLRPNSVPSTPKCAVISQSESARSIRILWVTALVVFLLLVLVLLFIYMVAKNYDKLKQALQPPLRLPEHLREFLSREEQFVQFPESSTSASSSEDEPFDKISLVTINKDVAEEELSWTHGHTCS